MPRVRGSSSRGVRLRCALSISLALGGVLAVGGLAGCVPAYEVPRVVEGRTIPGRFISDDAYAAYLRGALAEAAGDLPGAVVAYERAASYDGDDPEVWTRLAATRCRMSTADPVAGRALARALAIDPDYAPAWEARAACDLAAGDARAATTAARSAAAIDPRRPEYQVLLAGLEERDPARLDAARARIRALTLAHAERGIAWRALLAYARAHGDAPLASEAIVALARLAPSRRGELVRATAALAGEGEIPLARVAAAALVDRAEGGLSAAAPAEPARDLVARLALDEAIGRRDEATLTERATRTHVGLDVAAARAVLLGEPGLARSLVAPILEAEPNAVSARLVAAAAEAPDAHPTRAATLLGALPRASSPLEPEVALAFLGVAARGLRPEEARALALPLAPWTEGDDLTARAAVDASLAGVLPPDALPPDAKVELAARHGVPYAGPLDRLDARHRLLALSLPGAPAAARGALPRGPESALGRDPVVTVAVARLALRDGRAVEDSLLAALRRMAASDPLALATALDLARRRGDATLEEELRARSATLGAPPRL